jgi:aspartate/methionine/tyrosine aminotransferase
MGDSMAAKTDGKAPTPEAQLQSFINRFDAKDQKRIRAIRAAVRKRFPTANELAYDYTSHVVIAYSATEQAIDAVMAIDARPGEMRLYLMPGPQLPDPKGLLMGSGKQARYVSLEAASTLAHPDVKALIDAAIEHAKTPLPSKGKGGLFMRGSTTKKRASRKSKK